MEKWRGGDKMMMFNDDMALILLLRSLVSGQGNLDSLIDSRFDVIGTKLHWDQTMGLR